MKRFRLIEESSTLPGLSPEMAEADRVDYIACIRQVLRQPLPQMQWMKDAEKSGRIDRALIDKKIGDILELEDADWEHLCDKVRNARWSVVDIRLLRFSHTILNATESVLDDTPVTSPTASGPSESPAAFTNGGTPRATDRAATPISEPISTAGGVDRRARPVRSGRKPGSA